MKTVLSFTACLVFVATTGCASFRAGHLPENGADLSPPARPKSVAVAVSGKVNLNGTEQDAVPAMIATWKEWTLQSYRDSKLFSAVTEDASSTDLRAEVRIVDRGEASTVGAFFTGLTLFLIPTEASDTIEVELTLKDRSSKELGKFQAAETMNTWMQLFMIFVMPFNSPGSTAASTFDAVHRATLGQAQQAKLL